MKVCILTHTFPLNPDDSTAAFLHTLVMGLKHNKIQPIVITPYFKLLDEKSFTYSVITYKYIWPLNFHILGYGSTLIRGTKLPLVTYFLAPLLFLFGVIKLVRTIKTEHVDVICSHWLYPSGVIALTASRLAGVPFTVTLPGSDVFVSQMNSLFRFIAVYTANRASAIIADSPLFIDRIKRLGAKPQKTMVIAYPVDVDVCKRNEAHVNELKEAIGIKNSDIVILGVGRLVEKKGFVYLISSFKRVLEKNSHVRLVIVGEGDLREQLETYCKELKISNYIHFAGNIDRKHIVTYYNMADIFVMPSIRDTEGNVDDQPVALLEAMSCQLPVVATNFPGISLSVADKVNGFLTPQKNVVALAQAIVALASSEQLRKRMGKESRRIALEKFSADATIQKYMSIFRSIV